MLKMINQPDIECSSQCIVFIHTREVFIFPRDVAMACGRGHAIA